ncbi:MAG: PH domain-containing protein [Prevotellaceae bacterium]|jgi:hypothetical protein|nr:PH domain-containing protein [Prevotellaceae bacterium]
MATFTANRFSSDNALYPDRLEIDTLKVTYYKGYIFGYRSTVIARNNIASVSIGSGIFFADIVIETIGGEKITVNGLGKKDAKKIVELLSHRIRIIRL